MKYWMHWLLFNAVPATLLYVYGVTEPGSAYNDSAMYLLYALGVFLAASILSKPHEAAMQAIVHDVMHAIWMVSPRFFVADTLVSFALMMYAINVGLPWVAVLLLVASIAQTNMVIAAGKLIRAQAEKNRRGK